MPGSAGVMSSYDPEYEKDFNIMHKQAASEKEDQKPPGCIVSASSNRTTVSPGRMGKTGTCDRHRFIEKSGRNC
jgi:hypothetical protein